MPETNILAQAIADCGLQPTAEVVAFANKVLDVCAGVVETGGGARQMAIRAAELVEGLPHQKPLAQAVVAAAVTVVKNHSREDEDDAGVELRAHELML